jgi:hypothetical protein
MVEIVCIVMPLGLPPAAHASKFGKGVSGFYLDGRSGVAAA